MSDIFFAKVTAMEAEDSSRKSGEISNLNNSLIDIVVFSWCLKDVLNEELFKHQVVQIPLSFHSENHYYESFKFPLLEETRAVLSANLRDMERAPFAGITSLQRLSSDEVPTYRVNVDYWRSSAGKMSHTLSTGDIFVLTDSVPGEAFDFAEEQRAWTLASVVSAYSVDASDEKGISISFEAKFSNMFCEFNAGNTPTFAVFLANVQTQERIWSVLCTNRNSSLINSILLPKFQQPFNKRHICCSVGKISGVLSKKLSDSQSKVVLKSLCCIRCSGEPSVKLVWGSPGTGKTHTLSALIFALSEVGSRTIICANSIPSIMGSARYYLRLAKGLSLESMDHLPLCSLNNVVFYGDKNHAVNVDPDIEEILLSSRAAKVLEALRPFMEWRHCFTSMIQFLEDCASERDERVFSSNVQSLRKFISMFRSHFPRNSVTGIVFAAMDSLVRTSRNSFEAQSSEDSNAIYSIMDRSISILPRLKDLFWSLDEFLPSVLNKSTVRELCLQASTIIFCTASSAYEISQVRTNPISALIIDDAQRLTECESLIPLQLPGLKHAIFFGDECQMPSSVSSKIAADSRFGRSLFTRLSLNGYRKQVLNTQYRMHPLISVFPRTKFYNDSISDAPNVGEKSYSKSYLPGSLFGPYSFINISCGTEDMDDIHRSWKNVIEVSVALKIIFNLYKAWKVNNKKVSICVTSPYTAQVIEIREKLGNKCSGFDGFEVQAMQIDELHGTEVDILMLSTVRSNSKGSIEYLSNPQMTNLVLTRARHCLWIVGQERTLSKGQSIWTDIIRNAKERGNFHNVEEDDEIADFVVEVKKDLDQLDDFLSSDSLVFSNALWEVLFSDNFKKSFVKLKSLELKKSVIHYLMKLSNGWRPSKRDVNVTCERSRQVLKQFKVKDLCIVCSVDIVKEQSYFQVLRVWDLLPLCEIPVLMKRLDTFFLTYTDKFLNLCKITCVERGLEIPKTWESSRNIVRYKKPLKARQKTVAQLCDDEFLENSSSMDEGSRVSGSLLLMKFYPLSSRMAGQLLSSCESTESELPFELTSKEIEIIEFERSSFVLGRSGTGKTTVLIRKLCQREQLYHIASKGFHDHHDCDKRTEDENIIYDTDNKFLRQIFVTNNPRLCFAVKQNVMGLKRFWDTGISREDSCPVPYDYIDNFSQFNEIPNSFMHLPRKEFPLVITFNKLLMMLDGTLGDSFFDKFPGIKDDSVHSSRRKRRELMALETFVRTKCVDFEKFSCSYWPRFVMGFTRGLEPLKVYSEIMSHIKDGLRRGNLHDRELSRKDYFLHSRSRASNISASECDKIYDIFLQYEEKKTANGEYDLADMVSHLHRRLKVNEYPGEKFDFVYVDEVQDLTMAQIALFKSICGNVDEGFVFAGDTAQTIVKGNDFRFEDIRCLFYREFLLKSRHGEKGLVAEPFHLRQNFRTHDRILKLAQSVTDLLCHFFPQSIDLLSPEMSLIDGETPVLVEYLSAENELSSMFANSRENSMNLVGFGAEQVILVRDSNVKNEILTSSGKHVLVLTIEECKGLEFEDVILFNFLSSSPAQNEWRVMLEYMNSKAPRHASQTESFPVFCETKHRVLCSELKQLYVAITRTRQRLWIFENTDALQQSILYDYWKNLKIVEARIFDYAILKEIQVSSTPEEWISRGIKLFHAQNYGPAKMCFQKGKHAFWEKKAEAAGLQFSALQIYSLNPAISHAYLKKAAEIFESIGMYEQSAQCFYDSKEYLKAGLIYWEKFGDLWLAEAGECFTQSGSFGRAAMAYAKANLFHDCLDVCARGKLYEKGFNYIVSWKREVQGNVDQIEVIAQGFLEKAAVYYGRLGDYTTMMKFVRSFCSKDLMRSFLDGKNLLNKLLELEMEWGSFLNALNLVERIGKTLLTAELLEKTGYFREASLVILFYVLANSLWMNGNSGWPLKDFGDKNELLDKAKSLAKNVSGEFFGFVTRHGKILSDNHVTLFALKRMLNDSERQSSVRGVILCARKILDLHFSLHKKRYVWREKGEDTLLRDQFSVETLYAFWNVWKGRIMKILECLEKGNLGNNTNVYAKFNLDYLGVTVTNWSGNTDPIFSLIIPNAYWVKAKVGQHGDSFSLRRDQLVQDARSYWLSEIMSVANKVTVKLKGLYSFSMENHLPLHFQIKPLVFMSEVAKFLIEQKVQLDYTMFEQSADNLLEALFPMDQRSASTVRMTDLRETENLRKVLEEIISHKIKWKSQLSYQRIGDIVMAIFGGLGNLSDETYKQVSLKFNGYPVWASFVESLWNGSSEYLVAQALHEALKQTSNAVSFGDKGSISPICIIYLLEILTNTIFFLKGCFLSTKSSFLEWIINRDANENGTVDVEEDYGQSEFCDVALEFVATSVVELLRNHNKGNVQLHSEIVFRLFVSLCLICANSGKYCDLLFDVLDGSEINSVIPGEFLNFVRHLKGGYVNHSIDSLAFALRKIQNPLVVITFSGKVCVRSTTRNAIFVDSKALHEGKRLISTLFSHRFLR